MSVDSRKNSTRRALHQGLISLLKEKPISKVAATELCRLAGINRSTYYTHFSSPSDQLSQLEDEVMEQFSRVIAERVEPGSSRAAMTEICRFCLENRDTILVLFRSSGDQGYSDKAVRTLEHIAQTSWQPKDFRYGGPCQDYASTYVISGINGVLRKWLLEGPDRLSPEAMAAVILELHDYGLRGKAE